jgi:hypothetical protein
LETPAANAKQPRNAEAQEKVAPSTVWESGIGSLWRMCQATDDAGLPTVWARLAKVGIKHARRVLAAAASKPLASEPPASKPLASKPPASEPPATLLYSLPTMERPVISPKLARAMVALQFGEGPDDLEGCLSVFGVSHPNQASITAANKRSGLYDQQANGTHFTHLVRIAGRQEIPVVAVAHRLVPASPRPWRLPPQHCLPVGILRLFTAMDKLALLYLNTWIKGPQQSAELMTSIDIYTWSWVEQQQSSPTPVDPDYPRLAQQLRLREWSPPTLPAAILSMVKPTGSRSATASASGLAALKASTLMGPVAVNANQEPGVYDGAMSVAKMLKVKFPSKLPSGRTPCLYYHIHGSCSRNPCPYDNDHINHSAADTTALVAYVAEHRAVVQA